MVLREHNDPLNQSRGIMGPLENATGVQNNRGRLRQRFDFIRKLGQGTYGKVQLGIDKETGQEVAIKTIKKSKIETEADLIRIRREIQIMSSVRHPNIIHIYEVFENREKMVLVMEYAAGGELYDYLNERKILEEDEARRIFRQIASAVYYCHKHKICHRDLKLENILLDEKFNAKIADFGLSNVFSDATLLKTFCGSPLYASPEIVRGTPYKGPEVDCWSLGVLLYTLVYGAMPFDGSNFKRLVKQISNGDYFEPKKPAEASPLIRIMLTVDPKTRAHIGNVCAHPWINQGFDKDCLAGADELATQTPVRLDLLLALANCSAINHNQVVIDQQQGAPPPPPQVEPSASPKEGKTKAPEDDKKQPPTKPKRSKMQSKSKSKSSPLLEMIHDVEEELPLVPEEVQPEAEAAGGEDEDACDTLSEISEIQTLAEDMEGDDGGLQNAATAEVMPKAKVKKEKGKVKEKTKASAAAAASSAPVQEPPVKAEVAAAPAAAEPPAPPQKPKIAAKPDIQQEKSPEPPKVIKKKVVKPKAPPAEEEKKVPEVEKPVAPPTAAPPVEKQAEPEPAPQAQPSQPAPISVKEKSSTPEKDSSDSASKPKKLKERADSVSPTRIERRNSKVISQKTAELIQNLETKVSPTGSSTTSVVEPPPKPPGIKKLVIPSFKVSDAKSKFESKPPRPLITSVSRSKAAFEAKALQSQTSVEEKKPLETSGSRSSMSPETKQKPAETAAPQKPEPVAGPAEVKKIAAPPETPKEEVAAPATTSEQKKAEEVSKPPVAPPKAEPPEASAATEAEPLVAHPPPVIKSVRAPGGPGKIQIPAALAAKVPPPSTTEVKPVLLDTGKGGPRPAMMITKGKTTHLPDIRNLSATATTSTTPPKTSHPVSQANLKHVSVDKVALASSPTSTSTSPPEVGPPSTTTSACKENAICANPPESSDTEAETGGKIGATPPLGPAAAAKQKLLSKLPPPQNKEQAVKKISSVITKIVSSGSVDKGLNSAAEEGSKTLPRAVKKEPEKMIKTEVCFPVQAASTQERIIPIQLVQEDSVASTSSPTESTAATPTPQLAEQSQQQMIPGLPQRQQSSTSAFSRMNSTASQFSRQNSSDTESISIAPPAKLEPLKKCPREFLIPIKLEGSGQTVTPKEDLTSSTADASVAGEDDFRIDSRLRSGRFGRQKRYSGLLSDASFDDESSIASGVSGASSRRPSGTPGLPPTAAHTRSRSQGDEPAPPGGGTFKRYRARRHATAAPDMPLGRSDSFSSAEEDEEDAFQVLTAESLFTNLLDRVRNLTRRINRDDPLMSPNWSADPTTFGLWGNSPLREFMGRAPSETRSVASSLSGHHKAFSREPSVTAGGGAGGAWRRSLSRDLSGDSDSGGHSASINNVQSRSQLSSRLSTDLYETSSARSLPLTTRRPPASSYLSQRSVDGDHGANLGSSYLHNHGLHHTLASSPRSIYSRSLSHGTSGGVTGSDYGTGLSSASPQISRTLPLRRSLKTFDRSPQNVLPEHDTVPSSASVSSASTRLSLLDSKYEPSSYLTRLRSMSRERERDSSASRYNSNALNSTSRWDNMNGFDEHHYQPSSLTMSSISPASTGISLDSTADSIVSPTSSFSYGGGANDANSTTSSLSGGLSVQEKMNNYSQYYQSLSSSPFRRLPMASPSQIHSQNGPSTPTTPIAPTTLMPMSIHPPPIPPHSSSFGVGLSELSKNSQSRPLSFTEANTMPLTLATGNIQATSANSPSSNTLSPSTLSTVSSPPTSPNDPPPPIIKPAPPISTPPSGSQTSPKGNDEKPPTGSNATSSIPRWPTVSVRQHRPLSISSFPNGPRASSVSRVLSPPPQDKDGVTGGGSGATSTTPQKRREGRATSVERITKLLERKSVPREIPSPKDLEEGIAIVHEPKIITAPPPNDVVVANGVVDKPSGLKKPKFLQSLEKKWEKLTHSHSQGNASPPPPLHPPPIVKQEPKLDGETKSTEIRRASVGSPEPPHGTSTSEENSSHEEKINESVLLRRALSPEKKVKTSRLAGGTVGFMLGRFKKMEVNEVGGGGVGGGSTVGSGVGGNSKIPTGRPPLGGPASVAQPPPPSTLVSRFRRVQSAYGGATSDSCLTLTPKETARTGDTEESGMIRSAALIAKEKRRPRVEIQRDIPTVKSPDKNIAMEVVKPMKNEEKIENPQALPTLISAVATHEADLISRAVTCSPLPDILIDDTTSNHLDIKENGEIITKGDVNKNPDLELLTPVSIADSDATSGGSVEEEIVSITSQMKPEEDEESVSDRILRKSFYNRFNSVERRKSNSVTSASIARANVGGASSSATSGSTGLSSTSQQKRGGGNTSGSRLSIGSGGGSNRSSLKERPSSVTRRSISPAASTVGSYDSKESSDSRNRSPSPYYLSGLNKYNPNPLFKELITDPNNSTSGGEFRASEVGKKTEYSRRITSKLSKLLREIESDLNSCQLAKTGSEISVDGDTAALLLGTGDGIGVGNSGTRHSLPSPVIISKAEGNSGNNVKAKNDGDHDHATK